MICLWFGVPCFAIRLYGIFKHYTRFDDTENIENDSSF
jgi:hypothetical protein